MSKATTLIKKIEELFYLGQYNDYGAQPYDRDASELMKPFADLQLPDKPQMPDMIQTRMMPRKSRGEDGIMNPVQ